MKLASVLPFYLLSLFLFGAFFVGGLVIGTRFMLDLAMEFLGFPQGIAAVFPKLVAIVGGLAGAFWGVFLAALAVRFLGQHYPVPIEFGERPVFNTALSSFATFVIVLVAFLAFLGDRATVGEVFKLLIY